MSMSESTQPYSLTAEQNRGGANGFTRYESNCEFQDNALDANAPGYTTATVRIPGSEKGFYIGYDLGDGTQNLLTLYGIGSSVAKKQGATRGLKNYGHGAAIGRFNPTRVIHISRHRDALRASTLIYNSGELYTEIDAAKRAGDCDYRRIDREVVHKSTFQHASNCGLTDEIREMLDRLLTLITAATVYTDLRGMIERILSNTQAHYHFMILEYDAFPTDMEKELKDAMLSCRRDYYHALMGGRHIQYMTASEADPICADATNAVDPMGPAEKFPRLSASLELRRDATTDYLKFHVSDGTESKDFWLSYHDGDQLFYKGTVGEGPFRAVAPHAWDSATPVGNGSGIRFACSVVSRAEENEQKARVGSVYNAVTDMRGVQMLYHDHYLGAPIYNEAEWADKRNVSGLRVELSTTDAEIAECYYGIKTKKHSANFDGMHPLLQRFLNWVVMRVIIARFSDYKIAKDGVGITEWKFPYFCALMLNAKAKDPVAAPLPASGASSVSHESDSEDSVASNSVAAPMGSLPAIAKIAVSSTTRRSAISTQQVAAHLLNLRNRLNESTLEEIAATSDSTVVPKGARILDDLMNLVQFLEAHGLTYTGSASSD